MDDELVSIAKEIENLRVIELDKLFTTLSEISLQLSKVAHELQKISQTIKIYNP